MKDAIDIIPYLRNPEPNPLKDVPWNLYRPVLILGIKRSLSSRDISVRRLVHLRALEDLPECEQQEEDWDTDICGKEIRYVPSTVVRASKDCESIEDDDHGEVSEGGPSCIWLEMTLEDQGITINSLRLEGMVEENVRNADRAPREQGGNGGQILEPCKDQSWSTISD